MIKFYLYSEELNKKLIAEVADQSLANEIRRYCKNIYDNDNFMVTIKYPYKKEIFVVGNFNKFYDKVENIKKI